jgi:hypothetical protein
MIKLDMLMVLLFNLTFTDDAAYWVLAAKKKKTKKSGKNGLYKIE